MLPFRCSLKIVLPAPQHYLHHAKFNCNYGTPMVPLDRLFGYLQRYKSAAGTTYIHR